MTVPSPADRPVVVVGAGTLGRRIALMWGSQGGEVRLVDTGAQGKSLLEEGGVAVNGEVELCRGRQLQDGDVVVAREQAVRVVLPGPVT